MTQQINVAQKNHTSHSVVRLVVMSHALIQPTYFNLDWFVVMTIQIAAQKLVAESIVHNQQHLVVWAPTPLAVMLLGIAVLMVHVAAQNVAVRIVVLNRKCVVPQTFVAQTLCHVADLLVVWIVMEWYVKVGKYV